MNIQNEAAYSVFRSLTVGLLGVLPDQQHQSDHLQQPELHDRHLRHRLQRKV